MAYAISAWFDPETEHVLRGSWERLHQAGISGVYHTGPYRPHVTLAVCENLDVPNFVRAFGPVWNALPPLHLHFDFVGVFHNHQSVGFLGAAPSEELLRLHRAVAETVRAQGQSLLPHYLPGRWNPHCSLAPDLDPTRLLRFIEYTGSLALPLTAAVTRLGVIETPQERELATVP